MVTANQLASISQQSCRQSIPVNKHTVNSIKVTFILLITLLLMSCGGPQHSKMLDPDYSEESLLKLQSNKFIGSINNDKINLHFVDFKNVSNQPVVMIHGTPGSWSTFAFVLGNVKLQKTNHLISVDRLDWGESENSDKQISYPDFDAQVNAIAQMIRQATDQPVILVGHSLGASMAPSIAIKYPEIVKGIILVAGTVDPKLGGPRWYNKVARWKVIQWFLPDELIKSNKEIYTLKAGLKDAEKHWESLNIPITVIQGMKDKLVDPENVDFVEKKYANKTDLLKVTRLQKSGHFIPWEHTDEIVKAIQSMSEK